ncbi:hypothetical protein VKT23_013263 [Stygiomarasmius scandens]|uniref:F-box domain-containing protein n=1 Tax=Marasmiellus scandens TaxID=2682957 RepID=A0ABR1J8Q2_9AGAR
MTIETLYPFNPSLLTTNMVPNDDDMHRIRETCAEHSQDLSRMNAQIERLQASLDAIILKRDTLQSKLSSLQSIMSPLRTLPPEVLQAVFMHCLELFPIISAREAPVLLTRICSKWRSVAIDTPALWASFHVALTGARHPFESYDSTCNAIRDGLQTFLLRSSPLPVNVSLCSGYYSPGPYSEDMTGEVNRTLDVIVPHHKRWKYINLQLPAQCMDSVEHLRGEDLPNLETAVISCSHGVSLQPVVASPFFENAPRLQRLSLWARDHAVMFKLIGSASWARLTHFIICFSYWEESSTVLEQIAMLRVCVNLEECTITLPGINSETPPPLTNLAITLPKLKKIVIDCFFPSQVMTSLLDSLVLPELRELILDGNLAQLPLNVSVILSATNLLQKSSCSLTHFGFRGNLGRPFPLPLSWDNGAMVFLLRLMPELNTLNLSHTELMTEALLEAFCTVSPDSGEILCPKLAQIEFSDSAAITEQKLVHFISTRLSPPTSSAVAPLDRVLIRDPRPSAGSILSQFGDSVQLSTPWYDGTCHDQSFRRPTSQLPEGVPVF